MAGKNLNIIEENEVYFIKLQVKNVQFDYRYGNLEAGTTVGLKFKSVRLMQQDSVIGLIHTGGSLVMTLKQKQDTHSKRGKLPGLITQTISKRRIYLTLGAIDFYLVS
jgi:hypothetical protein